MSTEIQNPYFFWGSSTVGTDQVPMQYALFNAVDDRFVLTSPDAQVLQWIAVLFSSRYNLSVYRLTTAENWHDRLIDNTCCTQWTIGNQQRLDFTRSNIYKSIRDVGELVNCDDMPNGLLKKDTLYIMAAHYWVTCCLKRVDQLGLGHVLSSRLIDLAWEDPMITMIKNIFNVIYREPDFEKAQAQITIYEQNRFFPIDLL